MVERGELISLAEHRRRMLGAAAGSGAPAPVPATARPIGLMVFVMAVLALGILIATASRGQATEGVPVLPAGLRSTLFQKTLWEVGEVCTSGGALAGMLREHCVGQARFLLRFPECDLACRQVARRITATPHR